MKKIKNFVKILFISVTILMCFGAFNSVHAEGLGDIINAGKEWIDEGKDNAPTIDGQKVDENYFAEQFIGIGQILVAIGLVTITIVIVVMAIKWITAKPDQQAALKQQLIGLVVSAVVIFGALGIWSMVKGILENVQTELTAEQSYEQPIEFS